MASKVCLFLLAFLSVVVALANPVAGGGIKATFAGSPESWSGEAAVLRQLLSTRLEDAVAPELTVDLHLHRRVLAGMVKGSALKPDSAACIGSCPARGDSYTGRSRGCLKKYQCNG
ncbi:hypothetical protein SETIT_7G061300v2 [Setaria italica]|uniref:Uncharacterized protein n=1 Tax=Setaria italica TaxID=4555 RepID=K3YAZ1_SETIT|nr:uncharacterized protein LOC105914817 [Setaria italica]RCV33172.1 hypothetical protein SETIT_7G061300v2 [Setaria italica]